MNVRLPLDERRLPYHEQEVPRSAKASQAQTATASRRKRATTAADKDYIQSLLRSVREKRATESGRVDVTVTGPGSTRSLERQTQA